MRASTTTMWRRGCAMALLCWALAMMGCDAGSGAQNAAQGAREVPHNVRVLEVIKSDLEEYLTVTGPVHAVRGTDVGTEESGVVASIPREKGALVREGEVLVALDRDLLRAEMESADAEYELRRYKQERMRKLAESNSASGEELQEANTLLEQARRAAEVARLRFERAEVKAPYDGILVDRFVEVGQLVSPGTRVARLVDPFVLELEGYVTEREVAWLKPDVPVLVSLEGQTRDREIEATVHFVSIEADVTTGKFPVEIRIPNRQLKLRAGMVGRGRVLKAVHHDVITIPRDAIVDGPAGPRVFVVEEDRAQPREVTLGADQGLMVVISDGLKAGDKLIVRGQRELRPGALVMVHEQATARDGSVAADPDVVRERTVDPLADRGAEPALAEPRR